MVWIGVFALLHAWYAPLHTLDKGVLLDTDKGVAVC